MKLLSVILFAAAIVSLAGCDAIGNLFHHSHHDATVASASAPPEGNDTRYWDPQRNQWVAGPSQASSTFSTPKPAPADPAANPPPPAPTPRGSRATGVYNSSTGKIEWQSGGYTPSAAPTSTPTKHWWWPF